MSTISNAPKALIVDDDFVPRQMLARHLQEVGFECSLVSNVDDALSRLADRDYDLVVTDLRMPERNGHSLVVELLRKSDPPIIAVHTAVCDPRITEDLIIRGVSDVIYKPTNYSAFAGKMKGLMRRIQLSDPEFKDSNSLDLDPRKPKGRVTIVEPEEIPPPVNQKEVETSLLKADQILPLSPSVLTLISAIKENEISETRQMTSLVQREPSLCCEVMKTALRTARNGNSHAALNLDDAVHLIGSKRVAELAVAIDALSPLTENVISWLDTETARLRGIATHIALKQIVAQNSELRANTSLEFSALIHQLGRVYLGTLFPIQYRKMLGVCKQEHKTLLEVERSVFPMTHSAALTILLTNWGFPAEPLFSLSYVADPFSTLQHLTKELRDEVELLKTAICIGECACDRWQPWERVDRPTKQVLKRLRIESMPDLVNTVQRALLEIEPQITFPSQMGLSLGEQQGIKHQAHSRGETAKPAEIPVVQTSKQVAS